MLVFSLSSLPNMVGGVVNAGFVLGSIVSSCCWWWWFLFSSWSSIVKYLCCAQVCFRLACLFMLNATSESKTSFRFSHLLLILIEAMMMGRCGVYSNQTYVLVLVCGRRWWRRLHITVLLISWFMAWSGAAEIKFRKVLCSSTFLKELVLQLKCSFTWNWGEPRIASFNFLRNAFPVVGQTLVDKKVQI